MNVDQTHFSRHFSSNTFIPMEGKGMIVHCRLTSFKAKHIFSKKQNKHCVCVCVLFVCLFRHWKTSAISNDQKGWAPLQITAFQHSYDFQAICIIVLDALFYYCDNLCYITKNIAKSVNTVLLITNL